MTGTALVVRDEVRFTQWLARQMSYGWVLLRCGCLAGSGFTPADVSMKPNT